MTLRKILDKEFTSLFNEKFNGEMTRKEFLHKKRLFLEEAGLSSAQFTYRMRKNKLKPTIINNIKKKPINSKKMKNWELEKIRNAKSLNRYYNKKFLLKVSNQSSGYKLLLESIRALNIPKD
jgi:hypothetical protein